MNRRILLSFDVEEFDMPLEYNFKISAEEQMQVGKKAWRICVRRAFEFFSNKIHLLIGRK